MVVTVILPEHFIRGSLGPVLEKLRKVSGCDDLRIDLSGMESFDLFGLQLLISLSKGLGVTVTLFPAEKAERLRNMMNFIGMPASEYFIIGALDD